MGVIWDLCSGLGGWSEAFVQNGWEVVRIENCADLQHVPHTYMLDVTEWRDWIHLFPDPDVIVASPPCLPFSNAYGGPRARAFREGREYIPETDIVEVCKEIIDHKQPTWWAIENVAGSIKFLKPFLGDFRQKLGPFFVWGNIPYLPMPPTWKHSKADGDAWSTDPLRANKRALIPFEVSFELFKTLREQQTLEEWI